jgi:hypothetical protein
LDAGWGRRFAIAGLAVAVLAVWPASAFAGGATLSAAPDTNLRDGQSVTVTASGYPTNADLDLIECAQNVGCDFSNILVFNSGTGGGFTTLYSVRRLLNLNGVSVDCVALQNCILVSIDITDLSTGAQTSIAFNPNLPPPRPLHFGVDPQHASVRLDNGVARVTGTLHCNQTVSIQIQLTLTQVWRRFIFVSQQFLVASCSPVGGVPFAAVFRPTNGLFGAGTAKLHVDAFGQTSTTYTISKTVSLSLVPSAA